MMLSLDASGTIEVNYFLVLDPKNCGIKGQFDNTAAFKIITVSWYYNNSYIIKIRYGLYNKWQTKKVDQILMW